MSRLIKQYRNTNSVTVSYTSCHHDYAIYDTTFAQGCCDQRVHTQNEKRKLSVSIIVEFTMRWVQPLLPNVAFTHAKQTCTGPSLTFISHYPRAEKRVGSLHTVPTNMDQKTYTADKLNTEHIVTMNKSGYCPKFALALCSLQPHKTILCDMNKTCHAQFL